MLSIPPMDLFYKIILVLCLWYLAHCMSHDRHVHRPVAQRIHSRAIMRYLVGKFGGEDNSLYPRDLQKRAGVDRLLDYDLGVIYRALFENLVIPLRYKKLPKTTKEQDEAIMKAFERIDTLLKDKKFLTGNDLTIADFAIVVEFADEVLYSGDISKYPNAQAWYKRMQELPYYKEVNQPFYDLVENMKKSAEAS